MMLDVAATPALGGGSMFFNLLVFLLLGLVILVGLALLVAILIGIIVLIVITVKKNKKGGTN